MQHKGDNEEQEEEKQSETEKNGKILLNDNVVVAVDYCYCYFFIVWRRLVGIRGIKSGAVYMMLMIVLLCIRRGERRGGALG